MVIAKCKCVLNFSICHLLCIIIMFPQINQQVLFTRGLHVVNMQYICMHICTCKCTQEYLRKNMKSSYHLVVCICTWNYALSITVSVTSVYESARSILWHVVRVYIGAQIPPLASQGVPRCTGASSSIQLHPFAPQVPPDNPVHMQTLQ